MSLPETRSEGPPTAAPKPGWYLNAERPGFWQFWDGASWTDHMRPAPTRPPSSPEASSSVTLQSERMQPPPELAQTPAPTLASVPVGLVGAERVSILSDADKTRLASTQPESLTRGWYLDPVAPTESARWWNGEQWTGRKAPVARYFFARSRSELIAPTPAPAYSPAAPFARAPTSQLQAASSPGVVPVYSYWVRYRRRWKWSFLVLSIIGSTSPTILGQDGSIQWIWWIDSATSAAFTGLFWGSLVALVVAAFPGAPSTS